MSNNKAEKLARLTQLDIQAGHAKADDVIVRSLKQTFPEFFGSPDALKTDGKNTMDRNDFGEKQNYGDKVSDGMGSEDDSGHGRDSV